MPSVLRRTGRSDTFLGERYRRLSRRRGKKRAMGSDPLSMKASKPRRCRTKLVTVRRNPDKPRPGLTDLGIPTIRTADAP